MTSRWTEIVVAWHQPRVVAGFWCEVLGDEVIDDRDDLVEISGWHPTAEAVRGQVSSPPMVFARVPESKTVKNRVHLDVNPIDRGRGEEVERLLASGARRVDVGQGEQR